MQPPVSTSKIRRIYFLTMGILFIILGLFGLILPIVQGIFFIAVGLVLLSFVSPYISAFIKRQTAKNVKLDAMMTRVETQIIEKPHLILIAFLGAVALAFLPAILLLWQRSPQVPIEAGIPIVVYFYNPELDQGPEGVRCGENGLVGVSRILPNTQTPLRDAIKLLLRGEIFPEEKTRGVTTEFPLPGVNLVDVATKNDVAILTFDDPQNKTSGGSCRVAILWHQIEATAKQFSGVTDVRFLPEYLFQP